MSTAQITKETTEAIIVAYNDGIGDATKLTAEQVAYWSPVPEWDGPGILASDADGRTWFYRTVEPGPGWVEPWTMKVTFAAPDLLAIDVTDLL